MNRYYRPIVSTDRHRPSNARPVADGRTWFTHVEIIERGGRADLVPLEDVDQSVIDRISSARAPVAGLSMDTPRIMGILNVTPDSFSDGGKFDRVQTSVPHAQSMISDGADILDIGGESTRPGAEEVEVEDEIARTAPVIAAIRAASNVPISIDTRKSAVAKSAVDAGATMINDVSGFEFDAEMPEFVAGCDLPVCLMHAQGAPESMQQNPSYNDVLLDVYDVLNEKVERAVALGISRSRIIVDPGIGFGKTLEHNLNLLSGISLFHSLGCTILLGVSRKRFIGTIANEPNASDRTAGSIAIGMLAISQGVQILRVHDVAETRQALSLHLAVTTAQRSF